MHQPVGQVVNGAQLNIGTQNWLRQMRQSADYSRKKNFYAFRRSRVQARSNPGTEDQGGRCSTCI